MNDRLVVLILLLGALALLGWWLRRRSGSLTARVRGVSVPGRAPGHPVVLAFTSPDCVACQAAQQPALAELRARAGESVEIREVDVLAERETAHAFGVFSVPSTIVMAADGRVVAFNIGYAPTPRLLAQLAVARNGDVAARR